MRFISFFSKFISVLNWRDSSKPSQERRLKEINSISFWCPEKWTAKWNIKLLNIIMITYDHCRVYTFYTCINIQHTYIITHWIVVGLQALMKRHQICIMRVLYRKHSKTQRRYIHSFVGTTETTYNNLHHFIYASFCFCSIRIYL